MVGSTLYVIADTHVTPTGPTKHGTDPSGALRRFLDALAADVSCKNAMILHCGDIAEAGSREAYQRFGSDMSAAPIPIKYIRGNHDNLQNMAQELSLSSLIRTEGSEPLLEYSFDLGGERFIVLDATHEETPDPQGYLSSYQLRLLEEKLANDPRPTTIALHYSPFLPPSTWAQNNMVLHGGDALVHLVGRYKDRIRLVVSGHLHDPSVTIRHGVPFLSAGALSWQYRWDDSDDGPVPITTVPGVFHVVQYRSEEVRIYDRIVE